MEIGELAEEVLQRVFTLTKGGYLVSWSGSEDPEHLVNHRFRTMKRCRGYANSIMEGGISYHKISITALHWNGSRVELWSYTW